MSPVHERQAEYANDYAKRGLDGRASGRVEALGTAGDVQYALGDISPAGTATAPDRYANRPTGVAATNPVAGTIRVTFTPDTDGAVSYNVYRGSTRVLTGVTGGGPHDATGQPAGTHSITVRGRDEDGNEFTTSAAVTITSA